jgi:predicted nuclease of predicted toxin-antitoxin system
MNLSPDWVPFLRECNYEAVHWSTIGAPRATDRTIMAWARENGCVVFTNDLDFGALLAMAESSGPSVLQVRTQDVLPESLGNTILLVLSEHRAALESGAIITVDPGRSRARILPIRRP